MGKFETAKAVKDSASFESVANQLSDAVVDALDQLHSRMVPYNTARAEFDDAADLAVISARLDAMAKYDGTGTVNQVIAGWSATEQQLAKDLLARLVFPDAS